MAVIDHQYRVLTQQRIREHLLQQRPIREHLDLRPFLVYLLVEPDCIANLVTHDTSATQILR